MFCTQTFESAAAKDEHILEHFAQETCDDCKQNLIRIGGNLYILHSSITCIKEYDYDSENYYDDVSSKLATVIVEETGEKDEQQTGGDTLLENDALEIEEGPWIKGEPNSDEYEAPENPLAASNNSTTESDMDEDSQQQQLEANASTAESNNEEQSTQQGMEIDIDGKNVKAETNTDTENKQETTKKAGADKRECEFCGEFFHR